jgi:hypothetical protein
VTASSQSCYTKDRGALLSHKAMTAPCSQSGYRRGSNRAAEIPYTIRRYGGGTRAMASIPLTRNEIRRLFTGLSRHLAALAAQLHWSRWRRRHQATARACHYRRRAEMHA